MENKDNFTKKDSLTAFPNKNSGTSLKIQCPAKINLTLKVTGKRPDGFHNIESIMQTISLYDYLTINIEPLMKQRLFCQETVQKSLIMKRIWFIKL